MAKPKEIGKKPTTPKLPAPINPDGVKSVYANNMEINASGFDARLMFNEIIIDSGAVITVVRRANVVMSLPHLAAMVQVMQKQLAQLKANIEAAKKAQTAAQ